MSLLSLLAVSTALQTPPPAPATPPPPACSSAIHRQFDFWVGRWNVTAQGQPAGHNHIELLHDGCVVAEHWKGAKGGEGSSLNAWDPYAKVWRQFWVDKSGGVLQLEGGWNGTAMVLIGTRPGPDGQPQQQRITYTPDADGLRQVWEQSSDGGQTWTVAFDGLYRRE